MFSAMGSQLLAGLNSITRFVQTYGTTLFAIAIASVPGLNVVAAGFISGLVSGGNLKSAVLGALGAGMIMGIGTAFQGAATIAAKGEKAFAHGMVGGVMSAVRGGSFKA
ncbi:MAG: hypothetical protein Q9N68_08270, partial [Gammaproteobacteria bacterium]|nr:hypothetical protein [Gammaproteobacteria bacterium]